MSDTRTIDVSHIKFTSTAFPTEEDMKLWDSLDADEQRAVIKRDLDEAEVSGIADPASMDQIIERVRAETKSNG